MNIVIDSEFRGLIPPLTKEEYDGLAASIIADGCRDAIVLWGDVLVDGHNRYEICMAHDIPFKTVQKEFASRDDVKLWMMKNQLSRRNLNDFQRMEIIHKCEDAVRARARARQAGGQGGVLLRETFPEANTGRANDELGSMVNMSGKTYSHGVTVLENAPKPVIDAARKDELTINAAYQVTKMEPEQQQEVAQRIEQGENPKDVVYDVQRRPHVVNNSGNNEWYTPAQYIDLAREVLGEVDLDPASCAFANETVKARLFYSRDDDGLTKEWHGRVWMNPPYNAEMVSAFTGKFVDEYNAGNISEGIVLVNNATETSWFVNMANAACAIVFPRGRIRYQSPTRDSLAPLQGQAFLYFGSNRNRFLQVFSDIGWGAVIH